MTDSERVYDQREALHAVRKGRTARKDVPTDSERLDWFVQNEAEVLQDPINEMFRVRWWTDNRVSTTWLHFDYRGAIDAAMAEKEGE